MSDQPSLFDAVRDAVERARAAQAAVDELLNSPPRAHADDPPTSHEAARLAAPKAASHRARIITLYRERGELTADQVDALLGLPRYAAQRRTSDLVRDGWLEPAGYDRPTRSGASARVLRLTSAAIAYTKGEHQ